MRGVYQGLDIMYGTDYVLKALISVGKEDGMTSTTAPGEPASMRKARTT
jgi:hypothetical protein